MNKNLIKKICASMIIAAAASAVNAQTILKTTDPGSYFSGSSTVGSWTRASGATQYSDILFTGVINVCSSGGTSCTFTYSQATMVSYAYAASVAFKTSILGVADVTATATFTKTNSETHTESSAVTVAPGKRAQFISYMPRVKSSAPLKGVWHDDNLTRKKTQCGPRTCHTTTYYVYTWKPDEVGGTMEGNKNVFDKPVWEFKVY